MLRPAKFMLPHANNTPPKSSERSIYQSVAIPVPGKFPSPEFTVGAGFASMNRTTMPKAAVHKDRHA